MEFKIVCGTWIKENDEKALKVLQKSDRWLTAEELAEITDLPIRKVQRTLNMLNQPMGFVKVRKSFLEELEK